MKHLITIILILLGFTHVHGILPDSFEKTRVLNWELTLGGASIIDTDNNSRWKSEPGMAFGVVHGYRFTPRFRLRNGIKASIYNSETTIYHPYLYSMDMYAGMSTFSTNVSAGCDYILPSTANQDEFLYAGASVIGDIVFDAKSSTKLQYVDHHVIEVNHVKDSFPAVLPGIEVRFGVQLYKVKFELQYWEDVISFDIPNIPLGRHRRSFLGASFGYNFHLFENN